MEKMVHEKNFEQWSNVSATYHNIRPTPPKDIVKIILAWLGKAPNIIVDIGCGTGLSTTIWKDIAKKAIGIEPNDDMRAIAEKNVSYDSIVFQDGVSNETNLPNDYADIITVSQAFHWMDINSSLAEFYRILKPGGVLAIYDFALPPIIGWEIEKSFIELRTKCSEIWYSQESPPVHNDKKSYGDRIKAFAKFRYSKEVACNGVEEWPVQKVAAFLVHISNGDFAIKVDSSIKKDIDEFLDLIKTKCGSGEIEVIFPYAMVIAVK